MKREDIEEKYKWDLSHIFASRLEWEKAYSATWSKIGELAAYKGKLVNPQMALKFFRLSNEISLSAEKLYVYAHMDMNTDGANAEAVGLAERATSLCAALGAAMSFVMPELTALTDGELDGMINDPSFADYDYTLKCVKRKKPHVLSEKEEYVLARMGEVTQGFKDIFEKIDSVDFPRTELRINGKKVPLTHGTYAKLLENPDRAVRKKAFTAYYNIYEERINTIAACYANNVKKNNISADLRGYANAMEASMQSDDVPTGVYTKLIEAVEEGLPALHEYMEYRRNALGGTLHMYDLYMPLVDDADLGTDYESAFRTVTEALAPLGEEYRARLLAMKNERRIDVMESEGKRSGAYSWGAYGTGPYVLLNYAGTTHDIFTIAHELGHAMHSEYSDESLCYEKAGYSIFVAEVASTTNEILLLKHLLATTRDKKTRKYLLSYYLNMFRTTFFRQAMFAEFELFAHKTRQKGEALTVESLSKAYLKLNKKYYGKAVTHDKQIRYEWARIPHFYNAFYVYKYATGMTAAVTLSDLILHGGQAAKDRYFAKFLRAGGHKSPYEILKDAGVDLMTDEPYRIAMQEFRDALHELEKE